MRFGVNLVLVFWVKSVDYSWSILFYLSRSLNMRVLISICITFVMSHPRLIVNPLWRVTITCNKLQGIFRLPGGAGKLKMMKLLLDGGVTDLHQYDLHEDIHAVAGALKQYLRELPEPLLTHELYQEWMDAAMWVTWLSCMNKHA